VKVSLLRSGRQYEGVFLDYFPPKAGIWSLDISFSRIRILHHVFRNVVIQDLGDGRFIEFLS
jgi:hypothetical protein